MSRQLFAAGLTVILSGFVVSNALANAIATASITYNGTPAGGASDGPNSAATHAQASVSDAGNLAKSQVDSWTFRNDAVLDLLAGQSNGLATANGSFDDSITVSASDPGTISFLFHVHGTLTPGSDYTLIGLYNGGIVDDPTWFYEAPVIDDVWPFTVPFTPGVPFNFQIQTRARAIQATGATGLVHSDFFNTTSIDSIQIDDPSATISGASGFDYQSLVPEPAGLSLLIFAGLNTRRRRR